MGKCVTVAVTVMLVSLQLYVDGPGRKKGTSIKIISTPDTSPDPAAAILNYWFVGPKT